jgi:hypothetical protein
MPGRFLVIDLDETLFTHKSNLSTVMANLIPSDVGGMDAQMTPVRSPLAFDVPVVGMDIGPGSFFVIDRRRWRPVLRFIHGAMATGNGYLMILTAGLYTKLSVIGVLNEIVQEEDPNIAFDPEQVLFSNGMDPATRFLGKGMRLLDMLVQHPQRDAFLERELVFIDDCVSHHASFRLLDALLDALAAPGPSETKDPLILNAEQLLAEMQAPYRADQHYRRAWLDAFGIHFMREVNAYSDDRAREPGMLEYLRYCLWIYLRYEDPHAGVDQLSAPEQICWREINQGLDIRSIGDLCVHLKQHGELYSKNMYIACLRHRAGAMDAGCLALVARFWAFVQDYFSIAPSLAVPVCCLSYSQVPKALIQASTPGAMPALMTALGLPPLPPRRPGAVERLASSLWHSPAQVFRPLQPLEGIGGFDDLPAPLPLSVLDRSFDDDDSSNESETVDDDRERRPDSAPPPRATIDSSVVEKPHDDSEIVDDLRRQGPPPALSAGSGVRVAPR